MNWETLKTVLAVARAGSLVGGATLLGMDQSTVGRKLTALESELGTSLFVRSTAGLAPTDVGQMVIARAENLEGQLNELKDDIAERSGTVRGLVRLIGNGWMIAELVREMVPELIGAHPELELRLIGQVPRVAARGEATISLWFEAGAQNGEFSVPIGDVQYAVYARAGLEPETLPWLSFFDEDAPGRAPVRYLCKNSPPGGGAAALTSTDARDILIAAEAGLGKALLPICVAERSGLLVAQGDGVALTRRLYLHVHPDTVQARRVQLVMSEIRSSFERLFSRPQGQEQLRARNIA